MMRKENIKSSNEIYFNEQSNMMFSYSLKLNKKSSNYRATSAAIMIPRSKIHTQRFVVFKMRSMKTSNCFPST